jgi:hypothetical protein
MDGYAERFRLFAEFGTADPIVHTLTVALIF